MTGLPVGKLGDLSKPATVLIEKISGAIGGIFKPWQIIRVAKAEAEAERIRAESEIQITDLHRRAFLRFLEEEAKKQSNIESITQEALPLLEDQSSPENVEDDWITNFFDKCRIISDRDMKQIWSRILAGEANSPGTFSKRTVNLLGDLDKRDAELLTHLCGFTWSIDGAKPLVFDTGDSIYNEHGISFVSLSHLESLGLIRFDSLAGFQMTGLPKLVAANYYGRRVVLTLPKDFGNDLKLGKVLLSRTGQELARVCDARPIDGFFEYVHDKWEALAIVAKRN